MKKQKIKVALADDHALLRKSLKLVVDSMAEFEVIMDEDNGKKLLETMNAAETKPEVCILDINMPEMNGYETAAAIKNKYPSIKILALSMYDNEQSIINMLKAGASGYLLKDVEPEELRKALLEIYDHDFYQSDIVRGQMLRSLNREKELSENEIQFLKLCCTELTYKEIAEKMYKSPRTIDGYRDNLFAKLNVATRSGLVMYAMKTGLVSIAGGDEK